MNVFQDCSPSPCSLSVNGPLSESPDCVVESCVGGPSTTTSSPPQPKRHRVDENTVRLYSDKIVLFCSVFCVVWLLWRREERKGDPIYCCQNIEFSISPFQEQQGGGGGSTVSTSAANVKKVKTEVVDLDWRVVERESDKQLSFRVFVFSITRRQ